MPSLFGLSADQLAMRETAMDFARGRLAPNALRWDKEKHFPLDVLREAASLGFAAINASEEHGGVGLARLDAVVIFEALAMGCPTIAAYLAVHNMCVWMIDRFGSPGTAPRLDAATGHDAGVFELLPHGARLRVRRSGASDARGTARGRLCAAG